MFHVKNWVFAQYLENWWTEFKQILYTHYHWLYLCWCHKLSFFANLIWSICHQFFNKSCAPEHNFDSAMAGLWSDPLTILVIAVTRAAIKSEMSSKFDQIRPWSAELAALITWELFKIFLWHAGSQVSDCCPLGYLFLKKSTLNFKDAICQLSNHFCSEFQL